MKRISTMKEKETLKDALNGIIDAIDAGNSHVSEETENHILDMINKATNTQNKLSKTQACKYLDNICPATFDNYVRAGKIPEGIKEVGFKEKFWTLQSLMKVKNELKRKS